MTARCVSNATDLIRSLHFYSKNLILSEFCRDEHGRHDHESYYGERDTESLVAVSFLSWLRSK